MDVPKNCWECEFTHICPAWHYLGDKCHYKPTKEDKIHEVRK